MSSLLFGAEPADNALRYAGPGHVESYFLRANHPTRPLAIWLKATVFAPLTGPAQAESWFIWFDGERNTTFAHKQSRPFSTASFTGNGDPDIAIEAAGLSFDVRANGSAKGTVPAPEGTAKFELTWTRDESPIGQRLSLLPWRVLRMGPFPKAKPLTPFPSLRFSGQVELPSGLETLTNWPGMQGHNWGSEHTFEYAWGQCLFPEDDAMMEGFTARARIAAKQTTPRLSALVVKKGARTFRFDTLLDPWRQHAELSTERWSIALRSTDGEATLEMDASKRPMVCLGYDNPNGARSYCFNSKLAATTLTVRPSDGASFTCHSAHGGALEFLRREPDPRFPNVI